MPKLMLFGSPAQCSLPDCRSGPWVWCLVRVFRFSAPCSVLAIRLVFDRFLLPSVSYVEAAVIRSKNSSTVCPNPCSVSSTFVLDMTAAAGAEPASKHHLEGSALTLGPRKK